MHGIAAEAFSNPGNAKRMRELPSRKRNPRLFVVRVQVPAEGQNRFNSEGKP